MKKPAAKSAAKSYGQTVAEKTRAKASRLSDNRRAALLERGLQLIYSGDGERAKPPARRA